MWAEAGVHGVTKVWSWAILIREANSFYTWWFQNNIWSLDLRFPHAQDGGSGEPLMWCHVPWGMSPQHDCLPRLWFIGGKAGCVYKRKFFFIVMAVLINPTNPYIFSRQPHKTGYGGAKDTSINQVKLERANWEGKYWWNLKDVYYWSIWYLTYKAS